MKVSELLAKKGGASVSATPDETLSLVARRLAEHRIGAVVVLDPTEKGKLVGILSERDIVRAMAEFGVDCPNHLVASAMTKDVITANPDDTTEELMKVMSERRIRHLPIMEDGQMLGVISIGDVVKVRLEEMQIEAEHLREFIAS